MRSGYALVCFGFGMLALHVRGRIWSRAFIGSAQAHGPRRLSSHVPRVAKSQKTGKTARRTSQGDGSKADGERVDPKKPPLIVRIPPPLPCAAVPPQQSAVDGSPGTERTAVAESATLLWRSQLPRLREHYNSVGNRGLFNPEAVAKAELTQIQRFEILVALILSANTSDENVKMAMKQLASFLGGPVSPEALLTLSEPQLAKLIRPVGVGYKRKASYLQDTATACLHLYGGDVPQSLASVKQLKGVGPKVGNMLMQLAWGRVEGIAVDTHVHRICNRLGWVDTRNAEQTRQALEEWLPREHWTELNFILVTLGKTVCRGRGAPKCTECPISDTCPKVGVT